VGIALYGYRVRLSNDDNDTVPTWHTLTGHSIVEEVSVTELTNILRKKYGLLETAVYNQPLYGLPVDQEFLYEVDFNLRKVLGTIYYDRLKEIVDVYIDAVLTMSVDPELSYDSERGVIIVSPPLEPTYVHDKIKTRSGTENEAAGDWGYAQKYYAVRYYNTEGEELTKPEVTVFTVARELKAPQVEFFKQDGFMGLQWEPVEGASEYVVLSAGPFGYSSRLIVHDLGKTMDTSFVYKDTIRRRDNEWFMAANTTFRDDISGDHIVVIAVGEDGASTISSPINKKDILSVLPSSISYNNEDTEITNSVGHVDELGLFRAVELCDDSLVQMPVTYHIDEVRVVDVQDHLEYVNEETIRLVIPYTVNGTPLRSWSFVEQFEYPGLQDDLQKLKEREEEAALRGGRLTLNIDIGIKNTGMLEEPVGNINVGAYKVFATNALSEYLAVNLLNGITRINLSDYPESHDNGYLLNAFSEALYQNPLILGIDMKMQLINSILYVTYEDSPQERERKQEEVRAEVKRIIADIIKPGMTDLEKELAINDYICDSSEYDYAALESGKKYNYNSVDPEFNDSFTSYGILLKKVGVCAGYAAAFKLLADEAGLESIVVTGFLSGDLPHAWNRVLIDGQWMTLDVTSNDHEYVRNSLFNIPDRVASTVLVEDNYFVIGSQKAAYTGTNEDSEYYRIERKFFSQSEVVNMLVTELRRNSAATLRTDYELTDKQYSNIFQAALSQGGWTDAQGYMWLGTIYIELT